MSASTLVIAAAAKEEESNFLVPNGTFIAELVAFAILLWLIHRYVLPPLSKAMTARQDMIDRSIKDSQEAKERLEAAEAEYHELLEQTKADASRIREEARAEGRAIIDELRTKAQEEADRVRTRGEEQLTAEREQVVAALRADLGRLATELAGRIVGESLDDDEMQTRVVDRFLEGFEAGASAREPHGAR
jgi:F-type H+-transporting ATPase subunit b